MRNTQSQTKNVKGAGHVCSNCGQRVECDINTDLYEACLDMESFIQAWEDVLLTNMTEEMLEADTAKLRRAIAKVEVKQ